MSTQVRHGPTPRFTIPTRGRFSITVVGYYTDIADYPPARRSRRAFFSEVWRWLQSWWKDMEEFEPKTQGLGAGGVTEIVWNSKRPEKRVNELLVLRTCFRDFYDKTMPLLGRQPKGAYRL